MAKSADHNKNAGRKRPHSETVAIAAAQPKGTVFRKSAKKAKQDVSERAPNNKTAAAASPSKAAPVGILKRAPENKGSSLGSSAPQRSSKGKSLAAPLVAQKPKTKKAAQSNHGGAQPKGGSKPQGRSKPKTPRTAPPVAPLPVLPPPTTAFRVIVGSYERLLYGLQGTLELTPTAGSSSSHATPKVSITLKPIFTFPAHVSSIRAVACAGAAPIPAGAKVAKQPLSKWLATGGTDETIKVWDLRKRIEVGALTGHDGTITSLSFPTPSYLLTTSVDSHLNLYRVRDWALLRTMRGHVGRVNCAAAHPSGRLALSVGQDRTIRMWDLMRGKGAASVKIYEEKEVVRWDSAGTRFAVLGPRGAEVYSTAMKLLHRVVDGDSGPRVRLHDVSFHPVDVSSGSGGDDDSSHPHELMFVATEDGVVKVYDLDAPSSKAPPKAAASDQDHSDDDNDADADTTPLTLIGRLVGHKNRVRAVAVQRLRLPTGLPILVATTISSDGLVRAFDLQPILEGAENAANVATAASAHTLIPTDLQPVGHFDTHGARLTCLAVVGVQDESTISDDADGEELDEASEEDLIRSDVEEEADADNDQVDLHGISANDDSDASDGPIDIEAEEAELAALQAQIIAAKKQGLWLEGMDDESSNNEDSEDEAGAGAYFENLASGNGVSDDEEEVEEED